MTASALTSPTTETVIPHVPTRLGQPLVLNNGSVIPNRFAKSALSETLGTVDLRVSNALPRLYQRWADGGVGLSITGNVMLPDRHSILASK